MATSEPQIEKSPRAAADAALAALGVAEKAAAADLLEYLQSDEAKAFMNRIMAVEGFTVAGSNFENWCLAVAGAVTQLEAAARILTTPPPVLQAPVV